MKWEATLRTGGRVLLPKELRESKGWSAGTVLKVEEHEEGIFLRFIEEGASPTSREKSGKEKAKRQKV